MVSPAGLSPYRVILGDAFHELHPNVQMAHRAPLHAEGVIDVVHGSHWLTPFLVATMHLPAAGVGQRTVLSLVQRSRRGAVTEMIWNRSIGRSSLTTVQVTRRGALVEWSRAGTVAFLLRVDHGTLIYEQAWMRAVGVRLPPRALPPYSRVRVAKATGLARSSQRGPPAQSYLRLQWNDETGAGLRVSTAIWLLLLQASLGAFDTLYYHEYRLRLPQAAHSRLELRLHAVRDFAYAVIIGSLGFVTWNGRVVWLLAALLAAEICLTLWDFIEEDRIRTLPAGERAMHAIMGIVYGGFLAFLIPEMLRWASFATGFGPTYHGFPAWLLLALAIGVFLSGVRDLIASVGLARR